METSENVQFVRLCLFPRVHFGVQFTSPMCPFSWVQFHPLMGQKMGQKWVRKNEVLKKVQKIRRSHQKSADFWSEWRDLNPRPLGPEPSALPTALHPGKKKPQQLRCCGVVGDERIELPRAESESAALPLCESPSQSSLWASALNAHIL